MPSSPNAGTSLSLLLAALLMIGSFASCAPAASSRSPAEGAELRSATVREAGRVITAAEIERSGAHTAWEAVERSHTHLSASAEGTARFTRRGQRSLLHVSEPIVLIDGARVDGVAMLRHLPAAQIARILILTGPEASHRYGTGAGAGAIVVETRR